MPTFTEIYLQRGIEGVIAELDVRDAATPEKTPAETDPASPFASASEEEEEKRA